MMAATGAAARTLITIANHPAVWFTMYWKSKNSAENPTQAIQNIRRQGGGGLGVQVSFCHCWQCHETDRRYRCQGENGVGSWHGSLSGVNAQFCATWR